ncbi:S8 family serine peptidase [Streptomyces hirsutus]
MEIRKDVVRNAAGDKADFVNIGVIEGSHGSHVAGITAAHGLFGGKMNGAAPGAKIVSSRACTWSGGYTSVALTEGMIDLVTERGVDIVNMSIGGLPALNDGNNARASLYTRLIDTYGVQLVISAGNSGPGANTIGDPSLADKVISVGASVSKETWAANYGSVVKTKYAMMPFSSRGPREDGGFTPTLIAPGASINTIQTWAAGQPVAEAGYGLPAGYGMLQGTSMASPQATGSAALLLSAAEQEADRPDAREAVHRPSPPPPSTSRACRPTRRAPVSIDLEEAWDSIRDGATAHEYSVKAPVDTAIEQFALKDPRLRHRRLRPRGRPEGRRVQEVVRRRRHPHVTGPDRDVRHKLDVAKNTDGAFRIVGEGQVRLSCRSNTPVDGEGPGRGAVRRGCTSAILEVDDPTHRGRRPADPEHGGRHRLTS